MNRYPRFELWGRPTRKVAMSTRALGSNPARPFGADFFLFLKIMSDEKIDKFAQDVSVKRQVILKLRELKYSLPKFCKDKSNKKFWELVDELPKEHSHLLHKLDIIEPTIEKDFLGNFLSPDFENFHLCYCSEHNIPINTGSVNHSKSELNEELISSILENTQHWKFDEEANSWSLGKQTYTYEQLIEHCNSYLRGERPWTIYETLVPAYDMTENFLNESSIDENKLVNIKQKLHNLKYGKQTEIKNDVEKVAGKNTCPKLPNFSETKATLDSLRHLLVSVKDAIENGPEEENTNKTEQISFSPYYKVRLHSLLESTRKDLENIPFEVTPELLMTRCGKIDYKFEPGSLEELLFTSEDGQIAPMPYTTVSTDYPPGKSSTYIYNSIRKYVSYLLYISGYKTADLSCINVLTDYLKEELQMILRKSANIMKGNKDHNMCVSLSLPTDVFF